MKATKINNASVPPHREKKNLFRLPAHQTIEDLSWNSQALSDVPSDIIIRSRIKYGNPRSTCKGLLMEYSKSTTIHGIRYLFEVHRPVYEKITWFLLLVTSFCLAVLVIWDNYFKWQDTPVILGFDETLVPIHKIPFPTITICPEIKSDFEMFSFQNVSQQILDEIEHSGAFENNANLTEEQYVSYNDEQEIDYNNNLRNVMPPLNNVTGYWSLDGGFINQGFHSYPLRTVFSTARNGFVAFLQGFAHNKDYSCCSSQQSFKVFFNSPESVPLTTGNYILVPHGNEVVVRVSPQYIGSSVYVEEHSSKKLIARLNAWSTTRSPSAAVPSFGCQPLNVPICNLTDIKCYSQAQLDLNLIIENHTMQKILDPGFEIMCDCMPACTSLDYNFEMTRAHYNLKKLLLAFRETYEHTDALPSRLNVYFKETEFTAIKRTVIFSMTTFVANCGGIFGLFMGISSLSFIELIYFFSVRLSANLIKRKANIKKLKNQLSEEDSMNETREYSQ